MAYAKRYGGGFVDKPTLTTPIDATFLNAVEAALLALYDANPGGAGMVPVWTPAGTHYVPQLLTNASIDPAAAIAKSKLAALNIADADVAGGAAIARSKLNFGAGLVDADIANAAAIALTKLASLNGWSTAINASAANVDLAWSGGAAPVTNYVITTGGGNVRNLATPSNPGQVISVKNESASAVWITHNTAGTGQKIHTRTQSDCLLLPQDSIMLMYDTNNWVEIYRDVNPELAYTLINTTQGPTGITTTGTGDVFMNLGGSIPLDNGKHYFESLFYIEDAGGNATLQMYLILDGTSIATFFYRTPAANPGVPCFVRIPFSTTSVAHSIQFKFRDVTTARSYTVQGTFPPQHARIVRAL